MLTSYTELNFKAVVQFPFFVHKMPLFHNVRGLVCKILTFYIKGAPESKCPNLLPEG